MKQKKKEVVKWTPEENDIALKKYFANFAGGPYSDSQCKRLAEELFEEKSLPRRTIIAHWYYFKRTNGRIARKFGNKEVNVNNSNLQDEKIKEHFQIWQEKDRLRNKRAQKLRREDKKKLRQEGKMI